MDMFAFTNIKRQPIKMEIIVKGENISLQFNAVAVENEQIL